MTFIVSAKRATVIWSSAAKTLSHHRRQSQPHPLLFAWKSILIDMVVHLTDGFGIGWKLSELQNLRGPFASVWTLIRVTK